MTFTAPEVNCIKSNTLRPLRGRLLICVELTVVASFESSMFTSEAAPVTSTTSEALPICSFASTCEIVPAFAVTSLASFVLKPEASTVIL